MKKWKIWIVPAIVLLVVGLVSIYQTNKSLPEGISYEGGIHYVENVDFLYDLTYQTEDGKIAHEQNIFPSFHQAITEAEEFIVIDMFLFNSYYDGDKDYPPLSRQLADALIEKKKQNPSLPIVFISDEVNTTYNSHPSKELEELKAAGISVVMTDLEKLRDPNILYSGFWRTFIQWFGQEGEGYFPNPFAGEAPKVTARSYLKLANVKANHRKVLVTDKSAIVTSANAHDASGYHSNIALHVKGDIIRDVLETELAAAKFSDEDIELPPLPKETGGQGNIKVQVLTEGKIKKHMLQEINETEQGDTIWLGMFYLADRKAVRALEEAAGRGAKVNIILDPNENAFGNEKVGLPNMPVAAELNELGEKNITIRWYNTGQEQYHTKLLFIQSEHENIILGGSTNYTRRNLADYNLETDLKIVAAPEEEISQETARYFERLWENQGATYTLPYEENQDEIPLLKYIGYTAQKILRLETY